MFEATCVRGHEKSCNLNEDGNAEEECSVTMKSIRNWSYNEDGNKIHL